MAPHSTQMNICLAFTSQFSKNYFHQPALLLVVRKNIDLMGQHAFNNVTTIRSEIINDPYYLNNPNEVWFYDTIDTHEIQYTPFFYDPTVTKNVLISLNQAIYSHAGEFIGTAGIDISSASFLSTFKNLKIGKTGGILVVDQRGNPIAPLTLRDIPMIGFQAPTTAEAQSQLLGTLPLEHPLNLNSEKFSDYSGADGSTYITRSISLDNRPWHLVAYQKKTEAFLNPMTHTLIATLIGIALFIFLSLIIRFISRTLSTSVQKLVENMDENAGRLSEIGNNPVPTQVIPYGPKEFQHIGTQLNALYNKLHTTLLRLKETLSHAEHATQAKSRFLSVMSHEIRTPLNSMIGLTDILILESKQPEQLLHLRVLQRAGQSLLRILNDVLDFSRLEFEKFSIESHEFDLYEMIRDIESLMQFNAESKGLRFKIHTPPQNYKLYGDSIRIRQVLLNLIGNAIKFTNKGTIQLKVTALDKTTDELQNFLFEVLDTGIGISNDQKEKIFSEFSQANPTIVRRFGGTGLGLSISRQITELMGGELSVSSELNVGSTFYFTLKLKVKSRIEKSYAQLQERSNSRSIQPIDLSLAKNTSRKILIVDDDEDNHLLLSAYLKFQPGIQSVRTSTGEEAIEQVKNNSFDLIIMDMQMPSMSGAEATRAIRKMEMEQRKKATPIVMLSANTLPEDHKLSLDSGANEHIGKPINLETFSAMLEKWLSTSST